ncbi:MAG TPA: PAS domain S-box protein [Chitinophagales bacterium]|nr:PAS domain S-box protein [Chitinophagales bacterium]
MDEKLMKDQYFVLTGNSGAKTNIRFRDVVEWTNEGVYCVDSAGIIVYANQRFCDCLGYKENEITGKEIFGLIYGDDHKKLSKAKMELRKKGISDSYDIQLAKKNGDPIWLRISGKPIIDESGEFMGSVVVSSEIGRQRRLEEELTMAKEELESKVIARTRQLLEANQMLNEEIKERKLAEISLKNSEKRFRDIFLNSPDAICIESVDGKILDVNDTMCRLHEATRDELIGKTAYEISPAKVHDTIRQLRPRLLSGEVTKYESECLTAKGNTIPIEVSAAQIAYKDQRALLMHVRDISERLRHLELQQKQNEDLEQKVKERTRELEMTNEKMQQEIAEKARIQAELQGQKDFLRLIIDSTPNLIFVKDKKGKYLLTNEAVARFYNMLTTQMEGHSDNEENFSQQDLDLFKEQDEQALASKNEMHFPERNIINRETGKSVWLQMIKKAIPSVSGDETNILGVGTDITAIKEAKEELRHSEQLYREIARNLPKAAMFIFDKEMKYILAEGPLVGIVSRPKNEIEGRTVYDSIRESDRERVETIYRKILEGESSEAEQTFQDRSLKVYHLPIRDEQGDIIYGMVMVFDISDLKGVQRELEQRATQLQRSNEELERFAYVASHDLQGPLRTIASYLQLLELRYKDKLDKEAIEFIDFSVKGAKLMQQLILDLLNYSRISSIRKPFTETDVNEVVKIVLKNLESSIRASKAQVIVSDLHKVIAEPNHLYQLFQNLIDNALKFTRDNTPVIKIFSIEHDEYWEFMVSDNGIGIKDEYKDKIFQIFQRLHTPAEFPGTGVGLAICKKVVQLHGGQIWFESSPGNGTTFHFTISKNVTEEN